MVKRGDIIYLKKSAYLQETGNIQGGFRPMLIISNDVGNKYSNLCIIVPLTKNKARIDFPTHVLINHSSVALCEQIFTINQSCIDRKVGQASAEDMKRLNQCLLISLGVMI